MAKTTLNTEGESSARALIRAGHYDTASAWSFDAEDGNKLLGPKGDDWAKFGRWHLGEDPSEPDDAKAHWKYPYGKDGKVYRRALAAIRSRASQNSDTTIFDAAGRLMDAMDDEEGKKESRMSSLGKMLGSRFGHFAAAQPMLAVKPDDGKPPKDDDDDEAKRTAAKKAEEEDEEMRRAEKKKQEDEDEEMRRSKRARRARKGRRSEGDDDDDAADDDEDEEDEEEMKRAAVAGHSLALDAAFRAGARAQRRRCAKIFDAKAAAANPVLAASLAFETPMTSRAAVALLEKTPAPRAGLLGDRMAASGMGAVRVGPSGVEAPKGPAAIAASWDNAMKPFGAPAKH